MARSSALERMAWVVVLLLAAVVPLVVAGRAFPEGSPDRDDVGYLSQADALRSGELTLPASTHDPYFRPFLSGLDGDRVIFKYQPAWPALLALSDLVTGSPRGALAVTGLAATLAVAALALEVGGRRRTALVAAAVFACSPWFIVQSGTYLAYPASAALLAGATALILRGHRLARPWLLVAGGALFGLGVFHRPFDAVLAGAPVAAWLVLVRRRSGARAVATDLARVALGALPFVLLVLAYDLAVTGSPLRMPFQVAGPLDRFGFGQRSSFGTFSGPLEVGRAGPYDFTPGEAWRTVVAFAGSLVDWLPGSLLVLPLAVVGLRWCARRGPAWLVAAQGLIVPIGYVFWWGAANARAYRLHELLGPIYWFPVLVSVVVLAAVGIVGLADRIARRLDAPRVGAGAVAGAVVVGLLAVSAATSGDTVRSIRAAREAQHREVALLAPPEEPGRSLVIVDRHYPGDPYVPVSVPARLDGEHLVAMDPTGGFGPFDLLDAHPGRQLWQVVDVHRAGAPFDPAERTRSRLVVREGEQVELAAAALGAPTYWRTRTDASDRGDGERQPLPLVDGQLRISVTAEGGGGDVEIPSGPPVMVILGVDGFELHWLARVDPEHPDRVQVLDPPRQVRRYAFEGQRPVEVAEDVSTYLRPD